MLVTAPTTFEKLVTLTAPGAPVMPVVDALDDAASSLREARPAMAQGKVSAELLGQLDRIQGATSTLRNALHELVTVDGMHHFDAAYAADDAHWDTWFRASADTVREAVRVSGQGVG